ncbi:MAG: hypothetical protein LBM01_03855 [Christensenellaceae bacterium]|jgi:hypothetical protein|nr:hypothetical protein [Christensenellaceae bacterium]
MKIQNKRRKSLTREAKRKRNLLVRTSSDDGAPVVDIKGLVFIWIIVGIIALAVFIYTDLFRTKNNGDALDAAAIIVSFAAFIMQSLFSIGVLLHNSALRKSTLSQFVSNNYTVVDFVESMTMGAESSRYTERLAKDRSLRNYMKEEDIVNTDDILRNMNDYYFSTLRIPFKIAEGKSVNALKFMALKFVRENGDHHYFIPCAQTSIGNTVILFNDKTKLQEVVINLVQKKSDDDFDSARVIPFSRIEISLGMTSLLGVTTNGRIELYFDNPKRLDDNGANNYKIFSSQFRALGMPKLTTSIAEDIL